MATATAIPSPTTSPITKPISVLPRCECSAVVRGVAVLKREVIVALASWRAKRCSH
jgi:hypothetical protein